MDEKKKQDKFYTEQEVMDIVTMCVADTWEVLDRKPLSDADVIKLRVIIGSESQHVFQDQINNYLKIKTRYVNTF